MDHAAANETPDAGSKDSPKPSGFVPQSSITGQRKDLWAGVYGYRCAQLQLPPARAHAKMLALMVQRMCGWSTQLQGLQMYATVCKWGCFGLPILHHPSYRT